MIFLYAPLDLPNEGLNYHMAATMAGFRPIVASWQSLELFGDSLVVHEGYFVQNDGALVAIERIYFAEGIIIHRTWGTSDHILEKIRKECGSFRTSFHPLWPELCDKRNVELCFRQTEKRGTVIPRPETFFVESGLDYSRLLLAGKEDMIIFKPSDGARCEGVMVSDIKTFDLFLETALKSSNRYIAQVVVKNPCLRFGRRFDIRVYVLIVSFFPLQVRVMREGVVRQSIAAFDPLHPEDEKAILTSKSLKDRLGISSDDVAISALIGEFYSSSDIFWDEVAVLVTNAFKSIAEEFFDSSQIDLQNSFLFAGVDILVVKEAGIPHLLFLEVNNVPGAGHWSSTINSALLPHFRDLFEGLMPSKSML